MFNKERFQTILNTNWLGRSFLFFEELESTNSYVKKIPAGEAAHGLVCLTDNQTRGRGQYERNWESVPGANLTFTLCLMPGRAERLHVLTLAGALALVKEIQNEMEACLTVKWPNDVLINGKKVAGLLTEAIFSGNTLDRVLVGIGINVNQEQFQGALRDSATSLLIEKGESVDREAFLARFLSRMEFEYRRWHMHNADLLKEINKTLEGYGKWVKLVVNGQEWSDPYKFIGVNVDGSLLVIDEEGELNSFSYEQIRLVTD